MPGNNVRIGVGTTGASKAASELDQLKDKFTKLQAAGAKGVLTGVGVGVGLAAYHALGNVVHDVTQIVDEATNAYIDNEHSIQKLNTAIRENVANWNGDTTAIDARLEAGVKLGFSNAEIRDSMAGLVGATHDVNEALHVQNVAMDLARFRGISLQDASEALTKVEAGSYRILKSLGIELKAGATQTEALAAVEKVASGQAADFAGTLEGKLAVAAAKSTESLSRLGKETASFKADVETAKADAIDNFATGLDFVADRANYSSQALERQVEILLVQRNELRQGSDAWNTMTAAVDALQKRIDAQKMDDLAKFPGKLRDDLPGATAALGDAATATAHLSSNAGDLAAALDRIRGYADKATGALQNFENAEYGATIAAGDLASAQQGLDDLLTKAPKAGTRAYTIWAGEVARAKQRVFDLQYQMHQVEGPKALYDWLEKQRAKLAADDKKGRDYLNTLIALASLNLPNVKGNFQITTTGTGRYGGKPVPLAEGGIVKAKPGGTLALIGEGGHDEAVVPLGKSGVVTGAHGTGGATFHVTVNISGAIGWTPGTATAFARQVGPSIAKYLQSHNLVPHQAIL